MKYPHNLKIALEKLPKGQSALVKVVMMDFFGYSPKTWYNRLNGDIDFCKAERLKLVELTGWEMEELFPETDKTQDDEA